MQKKSERKNNINSIKYKRSTFETQVDQSPGAQYYW
jgi:hypothetical protein